MIGIRLCCSIVTTVAIACAVASPSISGDAPPVSPFQPHVDMKTFMEHVLSPAAAVIWKSNGIVIDARGEHDLSPKSNDDWEQLVSGAATLAEATNALMIPQRALDPVRQIGAGPPRGKKKLRNPRISGVSHGSPCRI